MNRVLRRLPSPAMVVACIALIVAIGGTSYAAIKLPANSVGTAQLKQNAVTSSKVKNNSITGADVNESTLGQVPSAANATSATNATTAASATTATNATTATSVAANGVNTAAIQNDAVTSAKIANGAVQSSELDSASVGAAHLKAATFVQGTGVPVAAGASAEATVTCPAGTRLVSGGPEWGSDLAGTSIIYSVPTPAGNPATTWVVKGRVATGATSNTIFAEAACLAA